MKKSSLNDYAAEIQELSPDEQLKLIEIISANLRKMMRQTNNVRFDVANNETVIAMEEAGPISMRKYETVEVIYEDMDMDMDI